jgi:hypothetical protein
MTDIRFLEPIELVEERPFTHPRHTATDLAILRYMIEQLCSLLEEPERYEQQPAPVALYQEETHGRQHRFVIAQPEQLHFSHGQLTVVGFFGQKRQNISLSLTPLMEAMDQALRAEFPQHPNLFSYSTMELINGDCGNLVLFGHDEAIGHWGKGQAHLKAAYELSPSYYDSIRLYNGRLPLGLMVSNLLHITRIKYYDYTAVPLWRAIREIVPDGSRGVIGN